jgi:hypothetical protein
MSSTWGSRAGDRACTGCIVSGNEGLLMVHEPLGGLHLGGADGRRQGVGEVVFVEWPGVSDYFNHY